MYVARDGFYKMGAGNFHDQLIPNQPQRRALWNDIEFWEGRSTKWGLQTGVAQPHLPSKPSGYPFYFAHDPAHLVDQIGGMHLLQRCGLIVQLVSPYRCLPAGRAMAMLCRGKWQARTISCNLGRFFNKRANSYIGGYTFYFAHDPTHFLEKTGGGMHLLYRLGPNEPNSKHSLEENLWHVGSATSTEASLRVARLWLGWLPSQAKLPLHDGQRRTWQTCHCSWNVKSTIIKAGLPQHKPGSPWESWLLHTTSQLHLVALHHLYSGPFSILLADGCPQVAILTQLPFAVEILAQIWAK